MRNDWFIHTYTYSTSVRKLPWDRDFCNDHANYILKLFPSILDLSVETVQKQTQWSICYLRFISIPRFACARGDLSQFQDLLVHVEDFSSGIQCTFSTTFFIMSFSNSSSTKLNTRISCLVGYIVYSCIPGSAAIPNQFGLHIIM